MRALRAEVALSFIFDLTHLPTADERDILRRALTLSRELNLLRGTTDPTLALLESQLATLPALPEGPPAWVKNIPVKFQPSCQAIVLGLRHGLPNGVIGQHLGVSERTVRNRIGRYDLYGIANALGPLTA